MWIVIRAVLPEDWLPSLRIVVVEDQDPLRDHLVQLLESHGADVRAFPAAEDARLALEVESCDLLLSDVYMEGMGGRGLFEWVRDVRADLLGCMVFMTGDSSSETRSFVSSTGRPWLAKPFGPDDLFAVLHGVVHAR